VTSIVPLLFVSISNSSCSATELYPRYILKTSIISCLFWRCSNVHNPNDFSLSSCLFPHIYNHFSISMLYLFQQFVILLIKWIPCTGTVLNMWPDQGLIQTEHNPRFLVSYCSPDNPHNSVSDTLESFLSKVAFKSDLWKKLARTEHVLIIKVYFERRKIAKVFMTQVQNFFRKSLSKENFLVCHSITTLSLLDILSSCLWHLLRPRYDL